MLVSGIPGFQALLLLFAMGLFLWVQQKWRNAVAKKEEIKQLVDMVAKESAMSEFEAVHEYKVLPRPHQCAVCFCSTTRRCSQCKYINYCSGKCQIIHWRQGHKHECQPLAAAMHLKQGSEFCGKLASENQSEIHDLGSEQLVDVSLIQELGCIGTSKLKRLSGTRANCKEMQGTKLAPPKSKLVNCVDSISHSRKLNNLRSSNADKSADCNSQLLNAKLVMSDEVQPAKLGHKKTIRRAASSEMIATDSSKFRSSPTSNSLEMDFMMDEGENESQLVKVKEAMPLPCKASGDGFKKSMWGKILQLRASKQLQNYKITFPYELFVKLYFCDEELCPFGLVNCGNSCYANAVLQCLAFTRPLTSYLIHGFHSRECKFTLIIGIVTGMVFLFVIFVVLPGQKKEWCFICEFEFLILKAREGESPLSPINILSKIQTIGSHLCHGTEEDAHEFLRCAVETMQSVCLRQAGTLDPSEEETTLVGLTFGGYLRSKITCMSCFGRSERFERMMDLTVEIDGDIGTLEEALVQFTANEMLDGENKYKCSRCKSYVKAKKKLTVSEAPNILTIVLKRFQSGNFGKLNKSVRFPEVLDMAPYMCGKSDDYPHYNLYAVVVHQDTMNTTYTGHYVCYIKNFRNEWFGINDSTVIPIQLERVLLEEAYMLLYARHCPRAPTLLSSNVVSHGLISKKMNLEAGPSSLNKPRSRSNSRILGTDASKVQQKHGKYSYRITLDDSTSNRSRDLEDDWRFFPTQRASPVDSASESSSLFSCSDASSCSSASTKDSLRSEELSDFLFGEVGPGWYNRYRLSSNVLPASMYRNLDADL